MDHNVFLSEIKEKNVKVIAVSKTKSTSDILKVYNSGLRDFGENKIQEMVAKQEELPKDIRWHMIGHLQKNKVKYIASFIHLIHSVDSLELLQIIDNQAKKFSRVIKVLLQVKIATEQTKFGLDSDVLHEIIEKFVKGDFPNIKICGLMGMASFTDDNAQLNLEFEKLHDFYIELKEVYLPSAYYFKELSMGMSNDYKIAIEHGATMVRVGTLIFGQRY